MYVGFLAPPDDILVGAFRPRGLICSYFVAAVVDGTLGPEAVGFGLLASLAVAFTTDCIFDSSFFSSSWTLEGATAVPPNIAVVAAF